MPLFGFLNKGDGTNDNTEKHAHKSIGRHMKDSAASAQKTISLLLLGAGGSGKSTVLKQMEKIYNGTIEEKSMEEATHYIRNNILEDIYDLAKHNGILQASHDECKLQEVGNEEIRQKIASIQGTAHDIELTPDIAASMKKLWLDPGMQITFQIRRQSHIMDNTPYFLNRVEEIADPKYETTFQDYVRVRYRTTGMTNTKFKVPFEGQNFVFSVTDVGGQRTERKKWIHCFSDVHAVIYVMALSSFDQVLFEDHETKCWHETLNLFESTVGIKTFRATDFIVFLNKWDIFEEKVKEVPFTVFYPECPEEKKHDTEYIVGFIRDEFKARFYGQENVKQALRSLHFHVTCATDTNQIKTVMNIIQLETVRKLMKKSALM